LLSELWLFLSRTQVLIAILNVAGRGSKPLPMMSSSTTLTRPRVSQGVPIPLGGLARNHLLASLLDERERVVARQNIGQAIRRRAASAFGGHGEKFITTHGTLVRCKMVVVEAELFQDVGSSQPRDTSLVPFRRVHPGNQPGNVHGHCAHQLLIDDQVSVPPFFYDDLPRAAALDNAALPPRRSFVFCFSRGPAENRILSKRVQNGNVRDGVCRGRSSLWYLGGNPPHCVEIQSSGTYSQDGIRVDDGRLCSRVGRKEGVVDDEGFFQRARGLCVDGQASEQDRVGMRVGELGALLHLSGVSKCRIRNRYWSHIRRCTL
jgi:hypothetical protein